MLPDYFGIKGIFLHNSTVLEGDLFNTPSEIPYICMILPYIIVGTSVAEEYGPENLACFAVDTVQIAIGTGSAVENPISPKTEIRICPGEGGYAVFLLPGVYIHGDQLPSVLDPQGSAIVEINLAI